MNRLWKLLDSIWKSGYRTGFRDGRCKKMIETMDEFDQKAGIADIEPSQATIDATKQEADEIFGSDIPYLKPGSKKKPTKVGDYTI